MSLYLFDKTNTSFNNEGLGVLLDFVDDPEVIENINGFFELTFTYALGGHLADYLTEEMYISTKTNEHDDEYLLFRIYESEPDYVDGTIIIRARLKQTDDFMNSIVKARTLLKGDIGFQVKSLMANATPTLNYRVGGTLNGVLDIEREDDNIYNMLFDDNGLFALNGVTPKFTPEGITITKHRALSTVSVITEKNFISKLGINTSRHDMVTQIIPFTETKRDVITPSKDTKYHKRETISEKVYGTPVISPKVLQMGYPVITRFMEFRNDIKEELKKDETEYNTYLYENVDDLNAKAKTFFSDNESIDEYEVEVSIETLGLHMDDYEQISSLGLYDIVEIYLEEYGVNIPVQVMEVTYSPLIGRNTQLKLTSKLNRIEHASNRINSNAPSEQQLREFIQNQIINNKINETVHNFIIKDDGTKISYVNQLPPVETAIEGDVVFLITEEGGSIWKFINGVWVEILPLNFEQYVTDQLTEVLDRFSTERTETEQAINEALASAKEEAERLDSERQQVIDGKFEVVNKAQSTLEQSIATAEQNAQDALQKAGASEDLAKTAKEVSENALSQFQTTSQELSEAKSTAEQTLQNALSALNNANSVVTQSQTLLDNATQAKTEATNALIEAQKQLEASGVISGNLTTFKNEVNNAIKGFVTQATYDSNNKTLNTRINEWEKTANGIKTSISEVSGKVDTLSSDYAVYKNETEETVKGFTRKISAYEQDVTGYKNQVATFSQTVDGYKSEVAKQTKTVGGLTTEVANYKQAVDGYSSELSKNTQATNGYKTEVLGYKQTVDGYSSKLAQYTQSNNTLTAKVNDYEATVDGYTQSLTRVEGKIDGGVGGRNLIIGSETREFYPYQGSNLTHTHGIEVPEWHASDAIKVTGTTGSSTVFATLSTGRPSATDPDAYVKEGEPYTYSIYFKNDGANNITINSNGNVGGDVVKSGELKRVVLSDYARVTGSKSFNQFTISTSVGSEINFTYWHPQIEKSLIVSDWGRAIEDTVDITTFKVYRNQVKSTTDEHTRVLTALTEDGGRISKVEQKADRIETSLSDYAKTGYVDTKVTQSAGTITTQLTSLKGYFDNLQIGTRNLLSNTETFDPLPPLITNNPESEYTVDGSKFLKVGDVNGTVLIKFAINDTIKQGDVFTVSFMGRSWNSKTSKVRFKVPWGAWSETKRVGDAGIPTYNTFLVESPTREIPDYVETNHFWMEVEYPFYFLPKSLKIERGNKPTDWSQAPEDNVTRTEFQTVKETTSLYERTIGTTETGIKSNIAKITMTDSLFQTEVGKYSEKPRNLLYDPINLSKYNRIGSHNLITLNSATGKLLRVTVTSVSSTTDTYNGVEFPLSTDSLSKGDYSFRIAVWVDTIPERGFSIRIFDKRGSNWYFQTHKPTTTGYQTFTGNFTLPNNVSDFDPMCFQVYLRGNGQIAIGHGVLVNSSIIPSEIYDSGDNFLTSQVTQLSDSWALKLKSGKDIRTAINANLDGVQIKGDHLNLSGNTSVDGDFWAKQVNAIKVNAGNIVTGTLDSARVNSTDIVTKGLTSNVVKSTHILADAALFKKLFTNDLATQNLATKRAWIKSGMIGDAQIGTAQIGQIDASNGKIVNFDARYITANHAELITAGFNGLNSRTTVDGTGINVTNTDGEFISLNNNAELRSRSSDGNYIVLGNGRLQVYNPTQNQGYFGVALSDADGSKKMGVYMPQGSSGFQIARNMQVTSQVVDGKSYTVTSANVSGGWSSIVDSIIRLGIHPSYNSSNVNHQRWLEFSKYLQNLNGWTSTPNLRAGSVVMVTKTVKPAPSSGTEWRHYVKFDIDSKGQPQSYFYEGVQIYKGMTIQQGDLWIKSPGRLRNESDRRVKENIEASKVKALDEIRNLEFVQFDKKADGSHQDVGLIAQDSGKFRVQGEETEAVDVLRLIYTSAKAIQELERKVKELEEQNETLRTNSRRVSN